MKVPLAFRACLPGGERRRLDPGMNSLRLQLNSATLLVIGGWFLYFYVGGRSGRYLEPASELALLLTGVALLALGAFNLIERRYPLPATGAQAVESAIGDEAATHADHDADHDPGAMSFATLAGVVILAPLALATFGSEDRFSGGSVGSSPPRAASSDPDYALAPTNSQGAPQRGTGTLGAGLFPGSGPGPGVGRPSLADGGVPGGVAPPALPSGTRRTQAGSGWFFPVPPVLREEAAKGGRLSREQSYLLPPRSRDGGGAPEGGIALFGGLAGADAIGDSAAVPVDFSAIEDEAELSFSLADLEEIVARNAEGEYLLNIPQIHHSVGDGEVMTVLDGLPVAIVAQLVREASVEPGAERTTRLTAYRFSADCCPTHSRGISIPLDWDGPLPSYEEHGWYRLHGTLRFLPEGDTSAPMIQVSRFDSTDEPAADSGL